LTDIDSLLADTLKVPGAALQDDLSYGSISGWDSMTHIDLMLALEEAYGVEIDAEKMLELTSVGAIRRYVSQLQATG
jgi:acyl carrier protein